MIKLRVMSLFVRVIVVAVVSVGGVVSAGAASVQVPVPRLTIYPGQVIEQRMLVNKVVSSNAVQVSAAASPDAVVGKVARHTLLPGRPIDTAALREPYSINQGEAAMIVFQSGALTISGSGLALQSGSAGDVVSVRNVDSGRIVRGTVGTDGVVHVGDP